MSTTEERRNLRRALADAGFERHDYSEDTMRDGTYSETWFKGLPGVPDVIKIHWGPRSKFYLDREEDIMEPP